MKHPMPYRVKLSFVIFDILAELSVKVPGCQKLQMTAKLGGLWTFHPFAPKTFRPLVTGK